MGVADSSEFLERLARILVWSGCAPADLRREFDEICRKLKQPTNRWDPKQMGFVADLPHVIARWHDDDDYLDSEGRPRPLPVGGRGRSLKALIARALPSADPLEVIRSLAQLGALRRQGMHFLPSGRHLRFSERRVSAFAHGLMTLLGLMKTVEDNVTAPLHRRLFERTAINPRFPVKALAAFHRNFAHRAGEMIWDIDAQMRREELRRRGSEPVIRLGVGLYVFEDPLGDTTSEQRRPLPRRKLRAKRRSRAK